MRTIGLFLLLLSLLPTISCNQSTQKKTDKLSESEAISGVSGKTTILRYEVALFSIKPENFASELEEIAPTFGVFLGENYKTPAGISQLQEFVNDPQNRRTYGDLMSQYPNLDWLAQDLDNAFGIYMKEFPGANKPKVYSYISGFDFQYPVKYADSTMIISLDMYLGSDYKDYRTMGIPLYVSQRLTRNHIVPDCVRELCYPLMSVSKTHTLLDAMIEEGRIRYFSEILLPEVDDELLMGYSPEQLAWCRANETNLWSFMIENEMLYSTDAQAMSMFMTDGPFTSSFSQESPARTGAWLGWQIVRSYVQKNETSLSALLKNTNSQEILEKSGYKPRRK